MDTHEKMLERIKELQAVIQDLKEDNSALRLKIGELSVQQKAQKDLTANLRTSEKLLRFLKQINTIEMDEEAGNSTEENRSEKLASSSKSHFQENDTEDSTEEDEKNYSKKGKGEKKKNETGKRKKRKFFEFNNDFYRYNAIDKENNVELLLNNCKLLVKNKSALFEFSSSNQCAVNCVRKIYDIEKLINNNVRVKNLPKDDWENIVAFVRLYEQKKKKDEQDKHLLRGAVNHFLWNGEEDATGSEN